MLSCPLCMLQAQSDASSIEDWEVWGDPREVGRRRAERARERLPREDRLELMATEMAQVGSRAGLVHRGGAVGA
jgi:ATP-dependent RNA helicase DHX29